MKIAVIGIGNVGGTLGARWARGGHDVIFGVRDPGADKVKSLVKLTEHKARAALVSDAAQASDVVVLATPWDATEAAVKSLGALKGKTIVDCTNPITQGFKLAIGHTVSGGEKVASWAKSARVVKAFNTTGSNNMANPEYDTAAAVMFMCGDDAEAKRIVQPLISELGFDVMDAGPLSVARYLEPLAMLWINLAYAQGYGREFAFAVLKR
jgi:NADPH-dependent F420 reductase